MGFTPSLTSLGTRHVHATHSGNTLKYTIIFIAKDLEEIDKMQWKWFQQCSDSWKTWRFLSIPQHFSLFIKHNFSNQFLLIIKYILSSSLQQILMLQGNKIRSIFKEIFYILLFSQSLVFNESEEWMLVTSPASYLLISCLHIC